MNKGNFWRKIFRKGQLEGFPHSAAARYTGNMNKRDVSSTRTKLNRYLKEYFKGQTEEER